MRLYIIRHAQSTNNALANQRDRVCDPTLTALGKRQAELVAQHLANGFNPEYSVGDSEEDTTAYNGKGYKITHLYSSAMHRALLTAQPIGQALGLVPEVWLDIHEHGGIFLDHGDEQGIVGYPGKRRSEVLAEFSNYILPDELTEDGWWNPEHGMEDRLAYKERAIRVASTLREWAATRYKNTPIAMVSHGGFMSILLKALTSQLLDEPVYYHHYNTGITRLDFWGDGGVSVRHLNRFDHLPPELIS